MKEATGEANMTVITIALIGIVMVVGGVIIASLMSGNEIKSACSNAGGIYQGNTCYKASSCSTDNSNHVNCSGNAKYTCTKSGSSMVCSG